MARIVGGSGVRSGFDYRGVGLVFDYDARLAKMLDGLVTAVPDKSQWSQPNGADILGGVGTFSKASDLAAFAEDGDGTIEIVARALHVVDNDFFPPVLTTPGAQSAIEDILKGIAGISVTFNGPTLVVNMSVAHGLFSLNSTAGLTFALGNGILDAEMEFSGSVAAVNTALLSISYSPTLNYNGVDTLDIIVAQVDDLAVSDSGTVTINIAAVNDAPVITLSGSTPNFTEGGSPVAVDAGLVLSDVDAGATFNGFTMQITTNYSSGNDLLNFTNQNGMTATWFAGSGMLLVSGSAVSLANTQAAMRSVTFSNSSENPTTGNRNVGMYTTDGAANSNIAHKTIGVTAVNDAPVLAGAGTSLVYTGLDAAAAVDNSVTVTDVDNANIASGYVEVGAGYVTGEDVLDVTEASGITKSWNAGTGRLTLTGSTTKANWQALLRAVTFYTGTTAGNRTINFLVNDGAANSNVHSRTVSVATPLVPVELLTEESVELATENSVSLLTEG